MEKKNENHNIPKESREPVTLELRGQKIFGVMHKPLQAKRFPVVLICHGYGGQKVGKYRLYVELSHRLALNGIGSLRFDFRGSGDSEGEFSEMTLEGEVEDALIALNYLSEHKQVDKNRIGVMGRSLGGAVAMIAASRYRELKSICLWAPVYTGEDWKEKFQVVSGKDLSLLKSEDLISINGQIPGRGFIKDMLGLKMDEYVQELNDKPLFLIHGCQDHLVKPFHSESYVKARLNAQGETKFIQLPHSDHDFTPIDERGYALEETCKWFIHTL